jgi:hypothetical protein
MPAGEATLIYRFGTSDIRTVNAFSNTSVNPITFMTMSYSGGHAISFVFCVVPPKGTMSIFHGMPAAEIT